MTVRKVYVHIGPPKSGTTYLQAILWQNQSELARHGVVLARGDELGQRRAVAALRHRAPDVPYAPPRTAQGGVRPRDRWDRLVDDVETSDAETAVISVEQLCDAGPHAAATLFGSLAPVPVDLVYTARSLAKAVPGAWQTRVRNRRPPTWQDFLSSVRNPGDPDSHGGTFWRLQDPALSLPVWLEHIAPQRVHVVTVPAPGDTPELVWRRFASVLGVPPDGYDLDVPRANASLGGVEAEVMRRLAERTTDELPVRVFGNVVMRFVAREILERRARQSFPLVLPEREHEWLDDRAQQVIDYLRTGGFHVVGDLAELVPVPAPSAREPDDVSEAEVLALLDETLAAVVVEMARRDGSRHEARLGPDN